ncbi:hypothetical protein SZ64_03385 [Erythrobacter sp. SG61-1L]|uniref:CHAD domain-containing protein n=1 Tax=Erythrobacter sp. SG61-1L TaxID=1603897 RepID=UPI0006C8F1E9|nr:CHAD domain-containing protein [Erythrobacter sp. SG61-1L]KPL67221.1 hypothetical protein SZ64_03385 [Erythrobacter sp. SG61-1L]
MAYTLTDDDRTLGEALRRIAGEQIREALDAVEDGHPAKAVHEVRRRTKTLRGLIRLMRTGFDEFADADGAIRAIAHPLSDVRDAKVMLDTLEVLADQAAGKAARHMLKRIHSHLASEREAEREAERVDDLLRKSRDRLRALASRAEFWSVDGEGWRVVGEGAAITYGHMLKDGARALSRGRPKDFHELRKHVRYHWCHARLLGGLWPEAMEARAMVADDLAHTLGHHHDLAVLTARLVRDGIHFGTGEELAPVFALAERESAALESRARLLCGRLLAESGEAFTERWHALWKAWEATRS